MPSRYVKSGGVFVDLSGGGGGPALPEGVAVQDTAPSSPATDDVWIDTSTGIEHVFRWDGAEWVYYQASEATRVQVFLEDGTWTKPDGFDGFTVYVVGPGGGGGVGWAQNESVTYGAGGGGGGGGRSHTSFLAGELSTFEAVVVGTKGQGGLANGDAGSAGGAVTFGSGATLVTAGGGGGGGAGISTTNGAGGAGGTGDRVGGNGAAGEAPAAIGSGGGGGGRASSGQNPGYKGGDSYDGLAGGAGGIAGSETGSPGLDTTTNGSQGSGAGGGVGSQAGSLNGAGGVGGFPGGGGGGSGMCRGSAGTKAGGNGGGGAVFVVGRVSGTPSSFEGAVYAQAVAPSDPDPGDLWFDTTEDLPNIKMWNGIEWGASVTKLTQAEYNLLAPPIPGMLYAIVEE